MGSRSILGLLLLLLTKPRVELTLLLGKLYMLWILPLKLLKLSWILLVWKLLSLKLPLKLLMLGELPLVLRKLSCMLLLRKLALRVIRELSLKLGHLSIMLAELTRAWLRRGLLSSEWLVTGLRGNSNIRHIG